MENIHGTMKIYSETDCRGRGGDLLSVAHFGCDIELFLDAIAAQMMLHRDVWVDLNNGQYLSFAFVRAFAVSPMQWRNEAMTSIARKYPIAEPVEYKRYSRTGR